MSDDPRCVNCGQRERAHARGPFFLHCDPRLTLGDDDCTYEPTEIPAALKDPTP